MSNFVFTVQCRRIKKQAKYRVWFPSNNQLFGRIKDLIPKEQRTWIREDFQWEITTKGLYTLIKMYQKSKKINFDFGGIEGN